MIEAALLTPVEEDTSFSLWPIERKCFDLLIGDVLTLPHSASVVEIGFLNPEGESKIDKLKDLLRSFERLAEFFTENPSVKPDYLAAYTHTQIAGVAVLFGFDLGSDFDLADYGYIIGETDFVLGLFKEQKSYFHRVLDRGETNVRA